MSTGNVPPNIADAYPMDGEGWKRDLPWQCCDRSATARDDVFPIDLRRAEIPCVRPPIGDELRPEVCFTETKGPFLMSNTSYMASRRNGGKAAPGSKRVNVTLHEDEFEGFGSVRTLATRL